MRTDWPPFFVYIVSVAGLLLIWSVLAVLANDAALFPPPWNVFALIAQEFGSGELIRHLAVTLRRVFISFVVAMALGITIGILMGRSRWTDRWFDPWLIVFLNLPALVTIVLAYLWIGLTEFAAIFAVAVNKIPSVVVTIREGVRALDPKYEDLARVFRLSFGQTLRHIIFPQLAPFIASAGRTGISLIWKIVLVVEFLGRSDGVGFQIHTYFQLFDVGMILAYSISFIAVILVVEAVLLRPWEARASRWRRT